MGGGIWLTSLFLLAPIWGGEEGERISEARLREHVQYLASPELKGRGNRSDRQKAADYLEKAYRDLGLQPLFEGGSYRQSIPAPALPGKEAPQLGENVGACLPGSDPKMSGDFILLSAHYDHLGGTKDRFFPGADDNAAGVAMVLESARILSSSKIAPRRSVLFVNFDLEENLLWGSRWFVEHPPVALEKIHLFITADLIGRNLSDLDWPGVFVLGGEHGDTLPELVKSVTANPGIEVLPLGADIVGTRSDYGPFRDRKIPFLFFSCGQHPDYHSPNDLPERVKFEKLVLVSEFIAECTRVGAEMDQAARWVEKPKPSLDEVETLIRVTEVLLIPESKVKLRGTEELFVSRFHQQLKSWREQGTISKAERGEMVSSARQLLWMLISR